MQEIYQELKSGKKTIITITHDFDLALEQCDRLVIMAAGEIIANGDPILLFSEMEGDNPGMVAPQMIRLSKRIFKNKFARTVNQFVDLFIE